MRLDQTHDPIPSGAFAAGVVTGWLANPEQRLNLKSILDWRKLWAESLRFDMAAFAIRKIAANTDLPARLAEVGASLDMVEWRMVMMGLDALEGLSNEHPTPDPVRLP